VRSAPNYTAVPVPLKADFLVVLKSQRQLVLMRHDKVLKVYRVALGRYPKGHKTRKGDAKTPEGTYNVDYRLDSDQSKFYRALHISYPNSRDRANAHRLGVDPGGQIMIHGLPTKWTAKDVGHPGLDWTQGCIAITNREMDEVWTLVADGTQIDIYP
jgi:murein L,D-transpeptidase YafK